MEEDRNEWRWYCIYDVTDRVQIRNARGGLYSDFSKVLERLQRAKNEQPNHIYSIVVFTANNVTFCDDKKAIPYGKS